MAKIYIVGGCIRDKFLGVDSKDIDFTFVCDNSTTVDEGWGEMVTWLMENKFEIFLKTPDCFTIRAKFPKGHQFEGLVADFVMARKEVGYIEGTRRPILEIGTLEDDLLRRDFTVNALAEDVDELFFEGWTNEDRKQFVKEYHDWNGDPEEYDEDWLHLGDSMIMSFLAHKIECSE